MSFLYNYIRNLFSLALGNQPMRPLLFSYYITHRCNLNCRYCSDGNGIPFNEDKVEELNTEDAKSLITIISKAADTLDFTGGEPLLREDLAELLSHAKKSGLRTILNTKGIGLDARPEIICNTDVIVISIDSLNNEHLANIIRHHSSTAQSIIRTLEHLILKRNEYRKTRIVLSSVATPSNLADIREVLDFAQKHHLAFHISPELKGTAANPELRDNIEYRQLIDEIIQRKENQNGILGVPQYLYTIRDFRTSQCHPLLMPVIRPDGCFYYPCLEKKHADINLLEAGSYFMALKQSVHKRGLLEECKGRCHIFCHMGLSLLQRHPLEAIGEAKHWSV